MFKISVSSLSSSALNWTIVFANYGLQMCILFNNDENWKDELQ